jgi:la-related protein 1
VQWRVCLELADIERRHNDVDEARHLYCHVNAVQPYASQGWLEHAKMLEETGSLDACRSVLLAGLRYCPQSEALLVKGELIVLL